MVVGCVAWALLGAGIAVFVARTESCAPLCPDHGAASELRTADRSTGVWALTVAPGTPLDRLTARAPEVRGAATTSTATPDQVKSAHAGWVAMCDAWWNMRALDDNELLRCVIGERPPELLHTHGSTGASADLAHAIAFADSKFDLIGDLRVAATGTLESVARGSEPHRTSNEMLVGPVGGLELKVAAAIAADVDVLVVPTESLPEVRDLAGVKESGMRLMGASTVTSAFVQLAKLSESADVADLIAQSPNPDCAPQLRRGCIGTRRPATTAGS